MELLSKVEVFPDIQTYRASWANLFEKQTLRVRVRVRVKP